MKRISGFSLIELLIVVVIIGIIAAIAIPMLSASKRSANEGSIVAALRLLHGAQVTYSTSVGGREYAGDIGAPTTAGLNTLATHKLIDEVLGAGSKSGYNIVGARELTNGMEPPEFYFSAIPILASGPAATGMHRFGVATDRALRSDNTANVHYADRNAVQAAPGLPN